MLVANSLPSLTNGTVRELACEPRTTSPLLAVVIPVYKQPQYLADAVLSAVRQSRRTTTKVVIVNDGCPYESTDALGRYFRDAFPGEVYYIRKPNGGLSSARNYGIRFALATWPSVEAIFPLDADNRLSLQTLEVLWRALAAAGPDVGWIYQDVTFFGTEHAVWQSGVPFSIYRLLHEHFCEAGNLIHRRVFDEGVWYDEDMKSGYEDWELYIHAALKGFRGIHVADSDFLYRRHGHSMLNDAKSKHESIYNYIRTKHRAWFGQNDLTYLEHAELPRYALLDLDSDTVHYATDPLDAGTCQGSIRDFLGRVARWGSEPAPRGRYVPPVAVLTYAPVLELLRDHGVLPSLLYAMQKALARADYVSLSLSLAGDPHRLELISPADSGAPAMVAMLPRKMLELQGAFGSRLGDVLRRGGLVTESLQLTVGMAYFGHKHQRLLSALIRELQGRLPRREDREPIQGRSLLDESVHVLEKLSAEQRAAAYHAGEKREVSAGHRRGPYVMGHAEFAAWKHVDQGASSFPYCSAPARGGTRPQNILFALPWLWLGGVEQCVLSLADRLRQREGAPRLHLVLTERNEVETDPALLAPFETVTFLPPSMADRHSALVDILCAADVIVNAHSLASYELLPEVKSKSRAKFVSYLHVTDFDRAGQPGGYPFVAARHYENLIDHFVVISRQLARFCRNFGVPDEKLTVMPNAPSVLPRSRLEAVRLAEEKARRQYSRERPLRILFSGRFDRQKGIDRFAGIAARLESAGVPFEFLLVGKPVLSGADVAVDIPRARVVEPTVEKSVLASYYSQADMFLLPSRWEGVPLSLLEAMAFGNVVVATDVGAVREIVADGRTGYLLDATQSEADMALAIEQIIASIVNDPGQTEQMRVEACKAAHEASWEKSAGRLAELLHLDN